MHQSRHHSFEWFHWVLLASAVIVVVLFKLEGLIYAAAILAVVAISSHVSVNSQECQAVRRSIQYSADEIRTVIGEYDYFLYGTSTDALADRTIQRPALADPDCPDPDIQTFFHECASARRFLHRLEYRVTAASSMKELEGLLSVTDRRASELEWRWKAARQSAVRIGPQ